MAVLCTWLSTAATAKAQTAADQTHLPTVPPDKAKQSLLTFVPPDDPALAKAAGIVGIVHASIEIDETGNVKDLKIISGHPMLAPVALGAIRKWKYKPFKIDGKPPSVRTEVQGSIPGIDVRFL